MKQKTVAICVRVSPKMAAQLKKSVEGLSMSQGFFLEWCWSLAHKRVSALAAAIGQETEAQIDAALAELDKDPALDQVSRFDRELDRLSQKETT